VKTYSYLTLSTFFTNAFKTSCLQSQSSRLLRVP